MRLAFILLILFNLAFHVWSAGYLGGPEAGREPERLAQQIDPGKIRIVSPHQLAKAAAAAENVPATACRLISGINSDAMAQLEKELAASAGLTVNLLPSPGVAMHWVLIRHLANRAIADRKITELHQLGIAEGKIVTDQTSGPLMVSLGIFSSDKAAQEYLSNLNKKGVRSAVIETREQNGPATALEVRGNPELLAHLPQALATHAGASLGDCPVVAE